MAPVDIFKKKNLLHLNDDCLSYICDYLSVEDLSSLGATCSRLCTIAQQEFVRKPANKQVDVLQLLRSFRSNPKEKIECFFQCFGIFLLDITLVLAEKDFKPVKKFWSMRQTIFQLITKHCSDGYLESFHGFRLALISPHSSQMLRLFSGLEKIRLDCCTKLRDVLSVSKECQDLHINGWTWSSSESVLSLQFPKLQSFVLKYAYSDGNPLQYSTDCGSFLVRHPGLKVLKLNMLSSYSFYLNVIGELKELEVLQLCQMFDDKYRDCLKGITLKPLCKLSNLKTLVVDNFQTYAAAFILNSAATDSLEHLEINILADDNDFRRGLGRFRNLRVRTY